MALQPSTECWFLKGAEERGSGIVAGHIRWRDETLTLIEVDDGDFVVRPADLVVDSPSAPIGFSRTDDAAWAAIADLYMAGRA